MNPIETDSDITKESPTCSFVSVGSTLMLIICLALWSIASKKEEWMHENNIKTRTLVQTYTQSKNGSGAKARISFWFWNKKYE